MQLSGQLEAGRSAFEDVEVKIKGMESGLNFTAPAERKRRNALLQECYDLELELDIALQEDKVRLSTTQNKMQKSREKLSDREKEVERLKGKGASS